MISRCSVVTRCTSVIKPPLAPKIIPKMQSNGIRAYSSCIESIKMCSSTSNKQQTVRYHNSIQRAISNRAFCSGSGSNTEEDEEVTNINATLTPYQLLRKIKDLELSSTFTDSNSNLFNEQKWFNEFLDNKITKEQLIAKIKNLEKRNEKRGTQSAKYTNEEVILGTEKWIKEFIIGMNLCPFASKFQNKDRQTIHVTQTTGLFVASEWVDLHAQHTVSEKEIVTKILVFPNRPNFTNFTDMCDHIKKSPGMGSLLENQQIKMMIFHPKALNPLYLDGKY